MENTHGACIELKDGKTIIAQFNHTETQSLIRKNESLDAIGIAKLGNKTPGRKRVIKTPTTQG